MIVAVVAVATVIGLVIPEPPVIVILREDPELFRKT
jgi:hypothetical protein